MESGFEAKELTKSRLLIVALLFLGFLMGLVAALSLPLSPPPSPCRSLSISLSLSLSPSPPLSPLYISKPFI